MTTSYWNKSGMERIFRYHHRSTTSTFEHFRKSLLLKQQLQRTSAPIRSEWSRFILAAPILSGVKGNKISMTTSKCTTMKFKTNLKTISSFFHKNNLLQAIKAFQMNTKICNWLHCVLLGLLQRRSIVEAFFVVAILWFGLPWCFNSSASLWSQFKQTDRFRFDHSYVSIC